MDEFQRTAAERFRHFLAERRPSVCRGGRTPAQYVPGEARALLTWSLVVVRYPARHQEIKPYPSAGRLSLPLIQRSAHAALIQSP